MALPCIYAQAQFKALVLKNEGGTDGQSGQTNFPLTTTTLLRQFEDMNGHQRAELSPWVIEADDELPTLSAIFEGQQIRQCILVCTIHVDGLPEDVGLNVEIKVALPDTVAVTPAEEVSCIQKCIEAPPAEG
eukprot:scaffold66037_cov17-Tisochrysis_lutea.AAC.1